MKIDLEIEVSEKEIDFLKKNFLENRKKALNFTLSSKIYDKESLDSLIKLGLLKSELKTYNIILTKIGNLVLDKFDRDIKINQILDE